MPDCKRITMADLCSELGMSANVVSVRLHRGHSLYQALFGCFKKAGFNPNAEARRVAQYMESIGEPISIGDACEAVGVDRKHAGYTLTRLRAILGQRLVFHSKSKAVLGDGRPEALYIVSPTGNKRKPPRKRPGPRLIPKDLWRGWINPATGIKPPRLGYDLAPANNE